MTESKLWKNALALVACLGMLGIGCAAQQNQALMQAESSFDRASNDTQVQNHASLSLYEAEQALHRAQSAKERGADEKVVDHLAYLASQRVEIAEASAKRKQAEKQLAKLDEQRSATLLSAREQRVEQQQETIASLRKELEAKETDRGTVLTLSDVLFEVDKATLKPGAERKIATIVEYLSRNPKRRILIEGHTDSTGPDQYNEELSRERARAVAGALARHGIDRQRITTRGYGEDYPVATNDTTAGRQQNRRVEIVVLDPGERARDHIRGASL